MRRRHFLRITLAGAAAAAMPFTGCDALSGDRQKLSLPLFLTHFISTKKIDERIRRDFAESRVVTPAGWVLSRTEARQCALYSLTA